MSPIYNYTRNPKKRRFALFLLERDGDKCQLCGGVGEMLELDHIDGQPNGPNRWNLSNLRLLDKRCNLAERNRQRSVVSVKRQTLDPTYQLHTNVDYSKGSPEMQSNEQNEIPYRNWIQAYIKGHEEISEKEAINGGAEVVGGSPASTARYLGKLVSDVGPLRRYKNEARKWMVKAKENMIYEPERGGWIKRIFIADETMETESK